ncbi:hypothetical protein V8E53_002201 [Lactarius tabidus]
MPTYRRVYMRCWARRVRSSILPKQPTRLESISRTAWNYVLALMYPPRAHHLCGLRFPFRRFMSPVRPSALPGNDTETDHRRSWGNEAGGRTLDKIHDQPCLWLHTSFLKPLSPNLGLYSQTCSASNVHHILQSLVLTHTDLCRREVAQSLGKGNHFTCAGRYLIDLTNATPRHTVRLMDKPIRREHSKYDKHRMFPHDCRSERQTAEPFE